MQVFKGGGKGVETAMFEELFHPQFNARGINDVLAFFTIDLRNGGQAVTAFVFIDQRVDIPFADSVNHFNQVADRIGINGEAELHLRGNFVAIGHGHFTHVVTKTHHF